MFKRYAISIAVLLLCLTGHTYGEFGDELYKLIPFGTDRDRYPENSPEFGVSLGLSENFAVVGAEEDSYFGEEAGAAWAFDAQTGAVIQTLEPSDLIAGDGLGQSLAVEGKYAVIGADSKNEDQGAAYIFDLELGTQIKVVASDASGEWDFGQSAAIQGTTVIIGAEKADNEAGAAYLVDLETGAELRKLAVEGSTELGNAVDLYNGVAIVSSDAGNAYLFDAETGAVMRTMTFDGAESYGASVALNDRYVVVGDDDFNEDRGMVFVYDHDSGDLKYQLQVPEPAVDDKFGGALAVEGSTLLVGAEGVDEEKGAVFVFDLVTGTQLAKIQHGAAEAGEEFGSAIDLVNGRALIGAVSGLIDIDGDSFQSGAAYLFDLDLNTLADVNNDNVVDAADIDAISNAVRNGQTDTRFDVNNDGAVNETDRAVWVHALNHTYFGDANLDGEFGTSDLTEVFVAGEYEDGIALNSTWSTGDWNGNGDFGTEDLVVAFSDGGYELGQRTAAVAAVPEPGTGLMMMIALVAFALMGHKRERRLSS